MVANNGANDGKEPRKTRGMTENKRHHEAEDAATCGAYCNVEYQNKKYCEMHVLISSLLKIGRAFGRIGQAHDRGAELGDFCVTPCKLCSDIRLRVQTFRGHGHDVADVKLAKRRVIDVRVQFCCTVGRWR